MCDGVAADFAIIKGRFLRPKDLVVLVAFTSDEDDVSVPGQINSMLDRFLTSS